MSLYLLSPVIAELVLGSSPPVNLLLFGWSLCLLYGGGAILIRELALRWGKGWPTILVFGVAYAIAEEGIAVRTFFDPGAPPLAGLANYGWAGGVNWVWAVNLSLYHAIVSIALPIGLVMMAFPDRASQPWVSSRWLKRSTAGFFGVIALWLVVYQRPVDGGYLIASLVAIALLWQLAKRMPVSVAPRLWNGQASTETGPAAETGRAPSPRRVCLAIVASVIGVFAMSTAHGFGQPPIVAIAGMLAITAVTGLWLASGAQRPGWSDRQKFAIATGVFICMFLLAPFVELSGGHGQIVVAVVTAWLTRKTWIRLRARERAIPAWAVPATPPATSPQRAC